jgi:MFS family permease
LTSRRRFTMSMFAASAVTLLGLPIIAMPSLRPTSDVALLAVVVVWSVFHLFQYLATVALWSWLADIAPPRIRGRFLARRNLWMVGASIVSMLASGAFVYYWQQETAKADHWIAYALAAIAGALFMFIALIPLAKIPATQCAAESIHNTSLTGIRCVLADRRLLLFGCWFSFFNGITQSAQYAYFMFILGFGLLHLNVLRSVMRAGQVAISPAVGRFADRFGNRPVLIVSQLIVALGPLFYFLATPTEPWWVAAAWFAWIAYAGINISLYSLMLKLSPRATNANLPYIAVFFSVTGLFYATNVVLGGWLTDRYSDAQFIFAGTFYLNFYDAIFLIGWLGRTLGVVLLLWIIEPGAYTWPSILRQTRNRRS